MSSVRKYIRLLPLALAYLAFSKYHAERYWKGTGERSLMNKIIERIPYDQLLHLVDAGLYSFELLLSLQKKTATTCWPSSALR
jgi:hypothetical protein